MLISPSHFERIKDRIKVEDQKIFFNDFPNVLNCRQKQKQSGFRRKLPKHHNRLLLSQKLVSHLYLLSSLLRTLILWIQRSFWQVLASAVPFLLPNPLCLPFLLASLLALTRDLEWTATGFLMTRPSLISFLMFALELALAISLISLGSSQT